MDIFWNNTKGIFSHAHNHVHCRFALNKKNCNLTPQQDNRQFKDFDQKLKSGHPGSMFLKKI